jgi:predicted nucleotidyltransferase
MAHGPIKVSVRTRDRVRILAALLGRTQAEIVETALDEYLRHHAEELSDSLARAGGLLDVTDPLKELRAHKQQIEEIAARHGATNIRVFGSLARGAASPNSDIDLLVDFETGRSLIDHSALIHELQAALGREVDVAQADTLDPDVRDQVLEEAVPL